MAIDTGGVEPTRIVQDFPGGFPLVGPGGHQEVHRRDAHHFLRRIAQQLGKLVIGVNNGVIALADEGNTNIGLLRSHRDELLPVAQNAFGRGVLYINSHHLAPFVLEVVGGATHGHFRAVFAQVVPLYLKFALFSKSFPQFRNLGAVFRRHKVGENKSGSIFRRVAQ